MTYYRDINDNLVRMPEPLLDQPDELDKPDEVEDRCVAGAAADVGELLWRLRHLDGEDATMPAADATIKALAAVVADHLEEDDGLRRDLLEAAERLRREAKS